MADDWDPFADPADAAEPPAHAAAAPSAAAAPGAAARVGAPGAIPAAERSQDIYAALEGPRPVERRYDPEQYEQLVDALFDVRPDSDVRALKAALEPVLEDDSASVLLWRRAMPLLMDAGARNQRPNLFGLLVDAQAGILPESRPGAAMNEVAVDGPEGGDEAFSGLVVFVFGWGGGFLADMEDVVAAYRGMCPGAFIVRLCCNAKASFGLRCECAAAIRVASRAWAREAPPPGPAVRPQLLVHLFSNAGFFTWTEMLQSWKVLSDREEPCPLLYAPLPPMSSVLGGVVLDSACNANIKIDACVQSLVQSMAKFLQFVNASDHDGTEAGMKAADTRGRRTLVHAIGADSPIKAHLMTKPPHLLIKTSAADTRPVHELEPPVPLQFIYSRDDAIIACEEVEDYVAKVIDRPSRRGAAHPRTLVFDKSKHVFHKVLYKEEYWQCVRLFTSAVLARQ